MTWYRRNKRTSIPTTAYLILATPTDILMCQSESFTIDILKTDAHTWICFATSMRSSGDMCSMSDLCFELRRYEGATEPLREFGCFSRLSVEFLMIRYGCSGLLCRWEPAKRGKKMIRWELSVRSQHSTRVVQDPHKSGWRCPATVLAPQLEPQVS